MKKLIALFLILSMLLGMTVVPMAATVDEATRQEILNAKRIYQ